LKALSLLGSAVIDWFINLLSIIPKMVYFMVTSLLTILDVFQYAIRKLSGLDVYYVGENATPQTGDLALSFLRGIFEENSRFPALKNTFWSLVIIGFIMLGLSTIIGVIRNEYADKDNNKYTVIANAVRGMFMFLIVPVGVIFGLMISDVILYGVDMATTSPSVLTNVFEQNENGGIETKLVAAEYNGQTTYLNYDIFSWPLPSGNSTVSGLVFKVSAFEANRVRKQEEYDGRTLYSYIQTNEVSNFGIFIADNSDSVALMIDEAFANNLVLNTTVVDNVLKLGPLDSIAGTGVGIFTLYDGYKVTNFSKFNVPLIWVFYDLWLFNYIIAFAFLFVVMKIMVNVVFGLMQRLIEMVGLFLISPPLIGVMPLDNGKAFGSWRSKFVSKAISVYAVIIGFNIFYLINPYLQQIYFFPDTLTFKFLNLLLSTLFVLLGIVTIEGLIALFATITGGEDLNKKGEKVAGEVQELAKKAAMLTASAAGVGVAGMSAIGKAAGGGINKIMNGPLKDTGLNRVMKQGFMKRKDKDEVKQQRKADWNNGGAKKAYDNYVDNNKGFKNEMQNKFAQRGEDQKDLSYEDWAKSEKGLAARQETIDDLVNKKKIDSFDKFKDQKGDGRGEYKRLLNQDLYDRQERKNQAKVRLSDIKKTLKQRKRENFANSGFGRYLRANGNTVLSGLGRLSGFIGGNLFETVKDSTIRGGKGGLPAMKAAFGLKTSKQISEAEKAKQIAKQETIIQEARKPK
jgi:hypothetical protein